MVEFPPHIVEMLQRQLSQFGRVGSTRIFRHTAVPSLLAAATSAPVTVRFREPGTVLALYGQVLTANAADMAGTEVRVQIGGQEDLFTDGTSNTTVPFFALFGNNQNWFPLIRRATPGLDWTFTYTNNNPANAIVPSMMMAFIADSSLQEMAR